MSETSSPGDEAIGTYGCRRGGSPPAKKGKVDIGAALQESAEADTKLRRRELELREKELKLPTSAVPRPESWPVSPKSFVAMPAC